MIEKNQNLQVKHIAGENNVEKAKQLLKEKYFFVGLAERFEESMKLLKHISPYRLNLKYKRQIVASDHTIKKEILNDPHKMDLIKKYNQLDRELYDYVSKELFPKSLGKYIDEVSAIEFPKKQYSTDYIWKYRNSIVFNKFVYKTILKLLRKRG